MELLYQLVESIKLRLYVGISHPVLNGYTGLHNFVFDMLILGGMFTILIVREKNYFSEICSQQNTYGLYAEIFW
jgi:hypothetical protein